MSYNALPQEMIDSPLFTIEGLSLVRVRQGSRPVEIFRDFNLSIPRGVTALLGISGCGKTSLLNVLGGLLAPSRGTVRFREDEISGPDPRRGMVFQTGTLFPWRTVKGNITSSGSLKDLDKARRNELVEDLIGRVGLRGFEDSYPHELSVGMARRVEIARAIAAQPEVLLLDEPFSALDAQTRLHMYRWLADLTDTLSLSVVLVTHDIDEAFLTANRAYLLTARPAQIRKSYELSWPRPRNIAMLAKPDAVNFKAELLSLLDEERSRSLASTLDAQNNKE